MSNKNENNCNWSIPEFSEQDIRSCKVALFEELSKDILKLIKLWEFKYENLKIRDFIMAVEYVLGELYTRKYLLNRDKVIEVNKKLLHTKNYKY